jgi:hypothetical protein
MNPSALDVAFSTNATESASPAELVSMLGASGKSNPGDKSVDFHAYALPELNLPSGRIAACDAFIIDEIPFTRPVAPGKYPLTLLAARIDTDERIAFAVIRFSKSSTIKTWEMALLPGQDPAKLKPGEIFGYSVDSGTGCFGDANALKIVGDALDPKMDFYTRIEGEMKKSYRHTRDWVHIETRGGPSRCSRLAGAMEPTPPISPSTMPASRYCL